MIGSGRKMFRLRGESKESIAVNIRNAKSTRDAIAQGCKKLNISDDNELKLFTTDGVLICDDDLQDDDYIKELVVVMSKNPPSNHLSSSPMIAQSETPKSVPCTPSPGGKMEEGSDGSPEEIRLPTFSNYLHCELQKSGYKQCSDHCWKMASIITLFDMEIYVYTLNNFHRANIWYAHKSSFML